MALGDNYPLRAMDQGFQESLVHRGGGIGQPSDPIGAEGKYTDPTLFKNGDEVQMNGYCTDIYFDAAMEFMSESVKEGKNFFTYIATNAPHGPFDDVPPELYEEYRNVDFTPILVNTIPEKMRKQEFDKLARIAAMITNIDDNVGRLFEKLDELGDQSKHNRHLSQRQWPQFDALRRRHAWHENACRQRWHSITAAVSLAGQGRRRSNLGRVVRSH